MLRVFELSSLILIVGFSPNPIWFVLSSVVEVGLDCDRPNLPNLSDFELEVATLPSRSDKLESFAC